MRELACRCILLMPFLFANQTEAAGEISVQDSRETRSRQHEEHSTVDHARSSHEQPAKFAVLEVRLVSHNRKSTSSVMPSLLARVERIGSVDKLTGKVELRFSIGGSHKMVRSSCDSSARVRPACLDSLLGPTRSSLLCLSTFGLGVRLAGVHTPSLRPTLPSVGMRRHRSRVDRAAARIDATSQPTRLHATVANEMSRREIHEREDSRRRQDNDREPQATEDSR